MSVSDGQTGNANTFNAAFASKTAQSGNQITGKLDFANGDAESGDAINNIQKDVNNKTFKVFTVEQLSAGGSIASSTTLGLQRRKIVSDVGNVTMANTPFGTGGGWVDGTQIRIVVTNNTNTVTLLHNDIDYGALLNGDFTFSKHARLTLEWDADELRWVEVQRIS